MNRVVHNQDMDKNWKVDSHRLGYEARCRQQGEASVRLSQGHHQDIRYQLNMDNHRVGYEIKILRNRKTPMRVSVSVASIAVEIPKMNLWCAARLVPVVANASIGLAMQITYLGSFEVNKYLAETVNASVCHHVWGEAVRR